MIFEELKKRGLARESEDGVSIPMHPMVRVLILVLLAQILRPRGESLGFELSPTTDQPKLVAGLKAILSVPSAVSSGHVVSLDLKTVGVNLALVPMDELLAFRQENLARHRAYIRDVRGFVRELAELPEQHRQAALSARRTELKARSEDLMRLSKSLWKKKSTSFALGIGGAVWKAVKGDLVGAVLMAGSSLVAISGSGQTEDNSAYSYLFRARAMS